MSLAHALREAGRQMGQLGADAAMAQSLTLWEKVKAFVDTPAPYSPYSEYLLLLFVLWLLARRESGKKDFDRQAQEVLDEKYRKGELSREAYEKYRQELSMRVKR